MLSSCSTISFIPIMCKIVIVQSLDVPMLLISTTELDQCIKFLLFLICQSAFFVFVTHQYSHQLCLCISYAYNCSNDYCFPYNKKGRSEDRPLLSLSSLRWSCSYCYLACFMPSWHSSIHSDGIRLCAHSNPFLMQKSA